METGSAAGLVSSRHFLVRVEKVTDRVRNDYMTMHRFCVESVSETVRMMIDPKVLQILDAKLETAK